MIIISAHIVGGKLFMKRKICENCNHWKKIEGTERNLRGHCDSEKRKIQRTVPVATPYVTFFSLPGCDYWEG